MLKDELALAECPANSPTRQQEALAVEERLTAIRLMPTRLKRRELAKLRSRIVNVLMKNYLLKTSNFY
jgi:hypothetical protein